RYQPGPQCSTYRSPVPEERPGAGSGQPRNPSAIRDAAAASSSSTRISTCARNGTSRSTAVPGEPASAMSRPRWPAGLRRPGRCPGTCTGAPPPPSVEPSGSAIAPAPFPVVEDRIGDPDRDRLPQMHRVQPLALPLPPGAQQAEREGPAQRRAVVGGGGPADRRGRLPGSAPTRSGAAPPLAEGRRDLRDQLRSLGEQQPGILREQADQLLPVRPGGV